MTISKHTLPKRIISLLLAVAIMVGFVPIIDIDLTAFAAPTTKITLTDDAPQSGDNWVWDNTTQTLSLYNAIFSAGDSGAVIEYTGAETLKINQIGCNTIKFTGSSADTFGAVKAEKIEVIGSGILYILGYNALFDADSLKISNGYIYSNDAAALNKRDGNKTTVSNCALDIPNTEIMAYAQDSAAGFIMESGYVNCYKLATKYNASNYLAAEIEGGYLNVYTIGGEKNGSDYAYIKLGQAVVRANILGVNAAFKKEADSTSLSGLHKSTLLFGIDNSGIYYDTKFSGSKEICGSYNAYYDDTPTDRAVYYANDKTLAADDFPTNAGTIVCDDTLNLTAVSAIPAGMTIYGHTLLCSGTINGCLIGGGEVQLGSADSESTVSSTGRIYGNASLSLVNNATISEGGGAVTVKQTSDPIYLDSKRLTINGDLTAYVDAATAIFGSNDTDLVIGENAQIAAMSTGAAVFDAEQSFNTISGKAKNAGRIVYGMCSSSNDKLLFPANYIDNVIYIGSGFDAQLNCTASHNKFYYCLKNSYDAWYTLECTRPFAEDYRDLTVTITKDATGENVTSHFGIIKNSAGRSNEVKVQIRNNDLDVASGERFTVTFAKDGSTHDEILLAVTPDFTLDFTQYYDPTSPTQWSYCGDFYGANQTCRSATIGDKQIWAWYPNGAEGYTGKVLVLDGLVFDTTAFNAIAVPEDTTIVVKGDNKIQSSVTAIKCNGDATIVGDDALTSKLTAKSKLSNRYNYAAIRANNGKVTIKNFRSLVVEMGEAPDSEWGGGASGVTANDKKSYGIYGSGVTIENVTGRITAGDANESAAIAASSAINISNCDLTLSAYNYAIKAPTVTTATLSVLDNAYADDTLSTAITLADYNGTASNGIVTNTDYKIYTDIGTATRLKTKSIYTVAVEETGGSGTIALGHYGGTGTGTGPANVTYSTTDKKFQADERAWFETTITAPAGGYYIKKLSITDGSDTYALIDNSERQTLTTPRSVSIQGQPTINSTTGKITSAKLKFSDISSDKTLTVEYSNAYMVTYDILAPSGTVDFGTTDIANPIAAGTLIEATAHPNADYELDTVKVNGTPITPNGNNFSFSVAEQDTNVEIRFKKITYTVTANTPANGNVTFDKDITAPIETGTTVTATAAPDNGYKISSVKVNGTAVTPDANGKFSFTVTQNTTVEVTFSNIIHTVTANTPANGTVSFSPSIDNGVAHGTTVTATAAPDNGCKISSVRVNGTAVTPDANGKFSFTVNAHTLVEVSFTRQTYNVTLTTQPQNGTLTFEPDISNGVAHGATVTATATPNSGYKISSVKVNGTAVTPDANGKFSFTVTGNTTVEVTFARKQSSTGGSTGGIIHGSDILPRLDGKGYNYTRMAEVLATYPKGSTATIEVNGNYDIPLAVIKAIKDGGLKVKIITSYISSRYIDGEEIKTPEAINVSFIKTHKFEAIELSGEEGMQFTVKNIFIPADLTVILGSKNAGMFANLYKRVGDEFIFEACAKIGDDGSAAFKDCTDGGNYVIMLSEYSALPGDVNNDGKITAADASALLQYLVGLDSDKRKNLIMADFNGDEGITARDASLILKFLVNN